MKSDGIKKEDNMETKICFAIGLASTEFFKHLPHSPDPPHQALYDFLFPKLKIHLKSKKLEVEDMKGNDNTASYHTKR